jgi:alpha-ketoglutarate-dependent taurine dioxygenase
LAISSRELTPLVGAEILDVDLRNVSASTQESIKAAFARHGALLFRNQKISDDDLLLFSRGLGDLDPPPNQENGRLSPPGYPDIYVVSNVLDTSGAPIGALGSGEAVWHTDMSYLDIPPFASMLYALEIPDAGGNTWLCSMVAAARELPDHLRKAISGRRIKHDGTYNSGGFLRKGVTPTDDPHKAPGAWHPSLCTHPETGEEMLYLGRRRNSYVEGYDADASARLLNELWDYATQPKFCYEHRWQIGDLLLWDNRSTMHRRDPFDNTQRRVMHRTQIKGKSAPVPAMSTAAA